MLVKDVMTRTPVTVAKSTTVKAALALLARHQITSMPVLTCAGQICGVVSEADLIHDLVLGDPRAHEIPQDDTRRDLPKVVQDVMTPHAITVRPHTELAVAVDLITSTTIKSVPVLDDEEQLVGILSRSDVVRVLARADQDLAGEVDALLCSVGLDDWLAEVTEGTVELTGPPGRAHEQNVAQVLAGTVPGVLEVRLA